MSAARGHSLFARLLRMEGQAIQYLPFDRAASEEFEGWEEGVDAFAAAVPLTALVSYEFTERVLAVIGEDVEFTCTVELSASDLTTRGLAVQVNDLFQVGGKTYHVTRVKPTRHYGGAAASWLVALAEGRP